MFIKNWYLQEEAGDGTDGAGAVDRGDEFVPNKDDGSIDKDTEKEVEKELGKDKAADDKGEEPEDKGKDDEDKDKKDSRIRIPKHRVDEMVGKERARREALERELADIKKNAKASTPDTDIAELDKKIDAADEAYEKAVFAGKAEDAARHRAERRALERQRSRMEADHLSTEKASAARDIAVDQVKYDTLLARYEDEYPQLNPDTEDFDADLVQEVAELKNAFASQGISSATSLQRAVRYVLGPKKAAKGQEELDKLDNAEKRRKEREDAARKKATDAANKQAPRTDTTGEDSDKYGGDPLRGKSVFTMTQDEFAKLSEEALSKARGDAL